MHKYQSEPSESTIFSHDMKYLSNGRVFWNLTKNNMNLQSANAALVRLNLNLNRTKATKDKSEAPKAPKQNLLRFPAQPLEETIPRFMASCVPFLTEKECHEQNKIHENFLRQWGEGETLQNILEEVAKVEENWLAPRWLKVAYLQYRDPVTVYSSPGMTFPLQKFKDQRDYLEYTAKVIYGLGEFKGIVDAGKIPVVKMGKNELDNSQFGKVFGTCRIPKRVTDELEYNPNSKYVVVLNKNHFYKMTLYDEAGKLLASTEIERLLASIIGCENSFGIPYGVLTTDTRDNWAEAYEQMSKVPNNAEILDVIAKSMFTVSLDECIDTDTCEQYNHLILSLIHGGGTEVNSGNRWMDKTIQLVANPNGMVGFTYEHSPAEGQPIAMMMDYVVKNMEEDAEYGEKGSTGEYEPVQKLKFSPLNPCIESWLHIAKRNINKLVDALDMKVLKFEGFGKEYIKSKKLGPDSFVQMAIQLGFYKMYKIPAAQYESAHLRIYAGGRTETIRSCSIESLAFCKAMSDTNCDVKEKAKFLRAAVSGHQAYTRLALQGKGVDRHLFGLKQMALEHCEPIPSFFSSPGWVKSTTFRMSTSQVASNYNAFMGYGPATEDGYGCCYNPRDCDIILAISCWHYNRETDHLKMAKSIEQAFWEMKDVLDNSPVPQPPPPPKCEPKAKL